ncbi:unnamed protein product [Cochlearia groenlandica]
MPEGSPPVANEPPLPTDAPPAAFIPPPPVDDFSLPVSTSPLLPPRVGEKRGREADVTASAELPPATRPRTEAESNEDRANVASDSRAVFEEEEGEGRAAGLGFEGADPSARSADPSSPLGEGTDPPLVGGNEHGFYFALQWRSPFP